MSICRRLRSSRFGGGLWAVALVLASAPQAAAQTAENVAVVINENSADSQRIGEYYARVRDIPASNIIRIRTATDEVVDRALYSRTIELPVAQVIARERLHDRILYLVLTKGVPLRVNGTGGPRGTVASVDSELTMLYRRSVGQVVPAEGFIPNPYYLGDKEITEAKQFSHKEHDIFLVTRLDGFTVDEVIRLIDKGMQPANEGRVVLDQRDALTNRLPETWLEAAASRLTAQGRGSDVVLETTIRAARDVSGVLGYFSWGSTDPQNRVRDVGMGFAPGALAGTLVATSARTFREPPPAWVPTGDAATRSSWFNGSPESLVGDLIREGVTGVVGYVSEPSVAALARPQVLFPSYFSGFNLAEAYYLSIPYLGWQTVVIGDPLCAPFRKDGVDQASLNPGFDPLTELPSFFSERRVTAATAQSPGVPARAVALTLRSEVLVQRGDLRGASTASDEAIELAPRFVVALMQSATLDDGAKRYDSAIEKYRRILEVQPNNAIALNNLAFALATHNRSPAEALPLARRAVTQAPESFTILDTLAWVQYLSGDTENAVRSMARVLRANPADADIRLHAATIYAASGAKAVAESELATAIKIRPALANSEEVKRVREQIAKIPAPR